MGNKLFRCIYTNHVNCDNLAIISANSEEEVVKNINDRYKELGMKHIVQLEDSDIMELVLKDNIYDVTESVFLHRQHEITEHFIDSYIIWSSVPFEAFKWLSEHHFFNEDTEELEIQMEKNTLIGLKCQITKRWKGSIPLLANAKSLGISKAIVDIIFES